jgi:hypothetical protein
MSAAVGSLRRCILRGRLDGDSGALRSGVNFPPHAPTAPSVRVQVGQEIASTVRPISGHPTRSGSGNQEAQRQDRSGANTNPGTQSAVTGPHAATGAETS